MMTTMDAVPHKARLQDYFDGVGFERWSAIYGQAELSPIRKTVREGHDRMLAQARSWLLESCTGGALLDAGCGTGVFSVAMAQHGFHVTAVDIAPRMVAATRELGHVAGVTARLHCNQGDAEGIQGRYDAVVCFDVLVHYPRALFGRLCTHLAALSAGPLLFTYAPYNRFLAALHWVGGRFPHSQRRTEIQMIPEAEVSAALAQAGMAVHRKANISHGFYHVTLVEARPV